MPWSTIARSSVSASCGEPLVSNGTISKRTPGPAELLRRRRLGGVLEVLEDVLADRGERTRQRIEVGDSSPSAAARRPCPERESDAGQPRRLHQPSKHDSRQRRA
jgi:hypothetical protein